MAEFWASKPFLPSPLEGGEQIAGYQELESLVARIRRLSVAQGQVQIEGAADMLGGMQYHYQQFLRVIRAKACGAVEARAPDERYEAVAYLNRIGQFYYFVRSEFVKDLVSDALSAVPSLNRLIPFRHKYTAHRAMDAPRSDSDRIDIGNELSLGAIGGQYFESREIQDLNNPFPDAPKDLKELAKYNYRACYAVFHLWTDEYNVTLNPEVDHPLIVAECAALLGTIAKNARARPKG